MFLSRKLDNVFKFDVFDGKYYDRTVKSNKETLAAIVIAATIITDTIFYNIGRHFSTWRYYDMETSALALQQTYAKIQINGPGQDTLRYD